MKKVLEGVLSAEESWRFSPQERAQALTVLEEWSLWDDSPSKREVERALRRVLGDNQYIPALAQKLTGGQLGKELGAWGCLSSALAAIEVPSGGSVIYLHHGVRYTWDPVSVSWIMGAAEGAKHG